MIGRHSLTYTCSCEGCRRFVTVTYLQAEFDAQDRATQRGWSFLPAAYLLISFILERIL